METSKLSTPVAIIIGAVIVGGGLYLGLSAKNAGPVTPAKKVVEHEIAMSPVGPADHIRGSADAPIVIVEYSDLECPYCKVFHQTLQQVEKDYGSQIAWVYREFPLAQLHPKAPHEAQAAECAAEIGGNDAFWKYIDQVFEVTPSNNRLEETELPIIAKFAGLDVTKFNACLSAGADKDKIAASIAEAGKAGAEGTPFSVLVLKDNVNKNAADFIRKTNDDILAQYPAGSDDVLFISKDQKRVAVGGAFPYDTMKQILDKVLGK